MENEREGEVKVTLEVFSLVDSGGSGAPNEMGHRKGKAKLEGCCACFVLSMLYERELILKSENWVCSSERI